MSRSKGRSLFGDDDTGAMSRSEPGVSGMIGGSMGDRSEIVSSWNVNGESALLK